MYDRVFEMLENIHHLYLYNIWETKGLGGKSNEFDICLVSFNISIAYVMGASQKATEGSKFFFSFAGTSNVIFVYVAQADAM